MKISLNKKILRHIIFHFIVLIIIIFVVYIITGLIFSRVTDYCPFSHKINARMRCRIIDSQANRKLIEHINGKTFERYLSIYEKKNIWIVHPGKFIEGYPLKSIKSTIKFDTTYSDSLIYLGKRYPIVRK